MGTTWLQFGVVVHITLSGCTHNDGAMMSSVNKLQLLQHWEPLELMLVPAVEVVVYASNSGGGSSACGSGGSRW